MTIAIATTTATPFEGRVFGYGDGLRFEAEAETEFGPCTFEHGFQPCDKDRVIH